ncbi:MAG: DUF3387 domain-containing protein [Anaerolineae bacterium]|nr:DUF3387 domain-containing protein [Anaerolineae bacterium]
MRKLLDSHIRSGEVAVIVEQVNIFDADAFEAEIAKIESIAARADTIAHRVKRTVTESMERDPAFYERFSRLIDETIRAYREGRIGEAEYLKRAGEIMKTVQQGHDEAAPAKLRRYRDASAYYGVLYDPLAQYVVGDVQTGMDELVADVAIELERIIESKKIRDWTVNLDVQKEMRLAMEDYLWDVRKAHDLPLTLTDLDEILERVIEVARQRDQQ